MASWQEFADAAPELAAEVRERFTVRKHATMATLRRDGSPRISGTEVQFADAQMWIGSMPRARKALDLLRDPRVALHSPSADPPEDDPSAWPGEAKVAGRAVEVPGDDPADDSHRFRIDVGEVVLTRVTGDLLVVTSWHPGRGLEEHRRH
jgi:Pyridoxamine 5'-phosphate oxidase